MSSQPPTIPRRDGPRFVTDGGMETDLIFHHGVELPEFAAFPLLDDRAGRHLLADYYAGYAAIAAASGAHLLLESPTWRANPDWGERVGYNRDALRRINVEAIDFLRDLGRRHTEEGVTGHLVSGMVGPRGDGYAASADVDPDEAATYHRGQIEAFAAAGADLVTAYTLTDPGEAVGIVRAAREQGLPVAIAFTVETDGHLPGGTSLAAAIAAVDQAATPEYYLLNCAHPTHFALGLPEVSDTAGWAAWQRVIGMRVNASPKSHAELDEAETLDAGDIDELVTATTELTAAVGPFTVLGGCCGTDARHVAALWSAR